MLKEQLEKAEAARRGRNYFASIEYYTGLAGYFETRYDLKTSQYFHHRCLDVAADVGSEETLSRANLNLGISEEKLGNWEGAMAYHEVALELSTSGTVELALQIKSATQLCVCYQKLAEKLVSDFEGDDSASEASLMAASQLYEKCVAC